MITALGTGWASGSVRSTIALGTTCFSWVLVLSLLLSFFVTIIIIISSITCIIFEFVLITKLFLTQEVHCFFLILLLTVNVMGGVSKQLWGI